MDARNSSQLQNGIIYPLFAGYTKIYTFPAKTQYKWKVEWIDFLDDVANQIPNKFYLAD
jgi:hypothetical protein